MQPDKAANSNANPLIVSVEHKPVIDSCKAPLSDASGLFDFPKGNEEGHVLDPHHAAVRVSHD